MIPQKKSKTELFMGWAGKFLGFGIGLTVFISLLFLMLYKKGWIPYDLKYQHIIGSVLLIYFIYSIVRLRFK